MSSAIAPSLVSSKPVTAQNARVPTLFSLAELYPELPALSRFTTRNLRGFRDPGPGVPSRVPDFAHDPAFVQKVVALLHSRWSMITAFGPTGCGKTDGFLDFFSRMNVPVLHDVATQQTRMWDLVGDRELHDGNTEFKAGPLYKAMKFGYPFLLDEVYRLEPTVTSKLHMIRDSGELFINATKETLKAAPGFKMCMTSNQSGFGDFTGAYSGDSVQDVAFLNGSLVVNCSYPAAEVEERIVSRTLQRLHPALAAEPSVCNDYATKMVKVATAAREVYVGNDSGSGNQIEIPFSTRTLVMWAEFFVAFRDAAMGVNPLYAALDFVALDRASTTTRATVDTFVQAAFNIKRADAVTLP